MHSYPECAGTLLSFFDSRLSVLNPSTIDEEDCKSPCMPLLNRSLSMVSENHGKLWKQFLASDPSGKYPTSEAYIENELQEYSNIKVCWGIDYHI